ncbi:MAG: DUF63 family protein [Methanosarcinales archaeon]|nr:DUF63 family protein [Methanosarcinales archaeon]
MNPWIYKYYIEPIVLDSGYNPVNTITWALLLGVFLILISRIFRRMQLRLDDDLLIYTLPYVLAGSSLRVVEDANLVAAPAKYFLITPLIYLLVAVATFVSLVLCRKLFVHYYRAYAAVGVGWTAANLTVLFMSGVEMPWVPLVVISLGGGVTGALYLLRGRLAFLSDRFNLLILLAHMLDASSTYLGVDWLGYSEKHVVPTLLINLTGTALVMYPLKLMVLLPLLYLMEGALREEPSTRTLVRLALLVLGLAPATRNTLRMTLGI